MTDDMSLAPGASPRPSARRVRRLLPGAILLFVFSMQMVVALDSVVPLASSTAGQTSNGGVITFGLQPAGAKAPDGRGYFTFSVTDGAHITDHIAVNNYSLHRLMLKLSSTDAVNTPQGDFALLPANARSRSVGVWIKLPRSSVTIPPRGTVIVPFTVIVPHNAQPGDHAGGILATLVSSIQSKSGQKFRLLQTVGSRLFIRVSGVLRPLLTIDNVKVRYHGTLNPFGGGRATVSFTVSNKGNVALGARQTVGVSGLFGLSSSAKNVKQLGVLLPGFSVAESFDVPGVFPQVWMTANVSLQPLVLPGSAQDINGPFTASKHFWAIPWVLLLIILLVILVFTWRRRRRKRKPQQTSAPAFTTSPAEQAHRPAEQPARSDVMPPP